MGILLMQYSKFPKQNNNKKKKLKIVVYRSFKKTPYNKLRINNKIFKIYKKGNLVN